MPLTHRIDAAIDAAMEHRIVGCVVLVHRDGEPVYARAAGLADREQGTPMALDTIFRLASVTKPIVATAALRMLDRGLLTLDTPVAGILPWFTPPAPDGSTPAITLHHLLTHTSGLTYDIPDDISYGLSGPILTLEENLRRLARVPLAFAPGTGWAYGMGIDVLGGVIAAVQGGTLAQVVADHVTRPLGMTDTAFHAVYTGRLATPYADARPPIRMAEPQAVGDDDEGITLFSPALVFNPDACPSGGAGMAGTAADVMALLASYQGETGFLHPATRAAAMSNQIGTLARHPKDAGKGFCLIGAVVTDPDLAATPCPQGTVDWGGAWGHNWIIDPVNHLTIVTCTNTAFEGCDGAFREDIRNAVYG
ncbi:MAG: serine hydrolase domain-containing protein [Gemmobacter sp.]